MELLRVLLIVAAGIGASTVAYAQVLQAIIGGTRGTPAATTSQVLTGVTTAISGAGDRFLAMGYSGLVSASDTPSFVFPVGGSLGTLRINTVTAPTGAQTWVMTVNKNGSASSLTCTINSSSSPAGTCSDLSHTVTVAAGDYIDLLSHPTGGPATGVHSSTVVFTPTTANDTVIPGRGTAYSTSVQNASNSFESFSASSLANRRQAFVPAAGNLDQFFVISNAPGSGTQYAYAVAKNGVTTGTPPTCTIANTATTCNDTATSALSIADGDDLSFAATPSTTPAAATAAFGARFVPTSTPNFVFMGVSSSATDNATATRFLAINGSNISATETDVQTVVNSLTVTRMEIHLSGTAGGTSKAFTLNDNTSPTSLTCTIAAAASTCTATGSVAVTAAHLLSISDVPTGTTNARTVSVSLVANR